jgi:lipopolysaccharide/colanic/teichoic acid biosynthesis glycosyltransferase
MAGWALVKYGYASSKEDALVKLQYDLFYIKHWSPWLDIVILLKTVLDTVTLRGR